MHNFRFPGLSPVDDADYCAQNMLRDALRGLVPIHLVYELAWFPALQDATKKPRRYYTRDWEIALAGQVLVGRQ